MKKGKGIALLPIGVFLVLYLGLGILFEYVMEIPIVLIQKYDIRTIVGNCTLGLNPQYS